ncbi:MAG: hypothetical protein QUV35_15855 [Hydrogenophaga sp.]|uniref:hypothetical protein n=1 Tax=Hydrogenophaga sp. TaxID=1904254 RepID=UPI002618B514|nr:hypothetical protein [Hydrogenophaga sp.]MDM7944098.1 hypothetical protein [Hydrogenophaga sp.]
MPRRKPQPSRQHLPVPGSGAPGSGAPEATLRPQRTSSSDMERALPHPASSEETGDHGARDEPGVPGFLEPGTPEAGKP